MRRLESHEDMMRGVVTYELDNGERIQLDERAVMQYGAAAILRECGFAAQLPTERLPVIQHGPDRHATA